MNSLRVPLIVLGITLLILAVVVQLPLVAFGFFMSTFADGGFWWERVSPGLLHPLALVALLWLLLSGLLLRGRPTPRLDGAALTLLSLGILGSLSLSGAIVAGMTKGDWWLPLVWAIVPLLSLPYIIYLLGSRRANAPGLAA